MPDQPLLPGRLSLVIPAHNESENLPPLLRSCREVLPRVAADWEVVLVDDGSTDGEAEVAARAMEADAARLRVIRHERKSGYGVTVADGLRAAAGDFVGFMDGDGQFAPADMVLLAELIASGADLAGGWRVRRADPWHRSVVSRTFNVLVRVLYGIRFRDLDCGFKLMRRTALEAVSPLRSRAALINTELYFKASRRGCQVKQVGIPHHPRLAGVRSGGRLKPILRAVRELVLLRIRLAREGF